MTDLKEKLDDLVEELREVRDELNLQMHLAKAEVKDDWGVSRNALARPPKISVRRWFCSVKRSRKAISKFARRCR